MSNVKYTQHQKSEEHIPNIYHSLNDTSHINDEETRAILEVLKNTKISSDYPANM